ncbi:cytochrome c oxidase (aa3-type) subunit II [Aeropyrum camini SY1 = JCM 12091]|uniref:Cytochrome c oxidase (Aa3-type) subunit II n=1 Tax=Aeropyrum camini SY1 = JCM 12091 TaxID=1198449 RepID=U3T929_9CREN|nr:cytochrome c oxidase (aa3-type) subunit II [Aeropyrum camini SY1 = JCM 12091]
MPVDIIPTEAIWWRLFLLFTVVGVLAAGTVTVFFIYTLFKYRSSGQTTGGGESAAGRIYRIMVESPVSGKSKYLLFVTGLIVMGLIVTTIDETLYLEKSPPVEDALVVMVVGFQFGWQFEYSVDGETVTTINYLVVPSDTLVEFRVTSRDVFHAFGIPEFKNKIDAIPGILNSMWIKTPDEPGKVYNAYCYELCGIGHSLMVGKVIVVDKTKFYNAYNSGPDVFREYVNSVISNYK